ncbi:MAG: hypothetical protein HQL25_05365 [Candidatus Omnitrophica bacterium]|nr:hypothetical protein [Candidatus Omnitrophota bacterium]
MRKICLILFFLILVIGNNAFSDDLLQQLSDKSLFNNQRDEVVNALLKLKPTLAMSSALLVIMNDNYSPMEPGMPSKPWMDDRMSQKAKIWYAAGDVWDAWFREKDINKVKILCALLNENHSNYIYYLIFGEMKNVQWDVVAEESVYNFTQDNKHDIESRVHAYEVLMSHCKDKYIAEVLRFIASVPKKDQLNYFCNIFEVGNRFFEYSLPSQKEIIKFGFILLEEDGKNGFQSVRAVNLALQLGFFLKIPGQFASGVALFHESSESMNTVKNALKWKKDNNL